VSLSANGLPKGLSSFGAEPDGRAILPLPPQLLKYLNGKGYLFTLAAWRCVFFEMVVPRKIVLLRQEPSNAGSDEGSKAQRSQNRLTICVYSNFSGGIRF
jgi:hypothetical protein